MLLFYYLSLVGVVPSIQRRVGVAKQTGLGRKLVVLRDTWVCGNPLFIRKSQAEDRLDAYPRLPAHASIKPSSPLKKTPAETSILINPVNTSLLYLFELPDGSARRPRVASPSLGLLSCIDFPLTRPLVDSACARRCSSQFFPRVSSL